MLSIVFFCSSDLSLGSPCFMRPKSLLSSICCFSMSSKDVSPLHTVYTFKNMRWNFKFNKTYWKNPYIFKIIS